MGSDGAARRLGTFVFRPSLVGSRQSRPEPAPLVAVRPGGRVRRLRTVEEEQGFGCATERRLRLIGTVYDSTMPSNVMGADVCTIVREVSSLASGMYSSAVLQNIPCIIGRVLNQDA